MYNVSPLQYSLISQQHCLNTLSNRKWINEDETIHSLSSIQLELPKLEEDVISSRPASNVHFSNSNWNWTGIRFFFLWLAPSPIFIISILSLYFAQDVNTLSQRIPFWNIRWHQITNAIICAPWTPIKQLSTVLFINQIIVLLRHRFASTALFNRSKSD